MGRNWIQLAATAFNLFGRPTVAVELDAAPVLRVLPPVAKVRRLVLRPVVHPQAVHGAAPEVARDVERHKLAKGEDAGSIPGRDSGGGGGLDTKA
jgi:hypothetical protein